MKVFVSLLIAACCLLVLPSAAMAVTYTVNSVGDQKDETPGSDGCKTSVPTCTLRAAIEESNASALVVDEINFDAAFNGQLADTITISSLLPPIANPVSINAGLCATEAGQGGPCAGVEASALSYGLSVENTDTVGISGLAITGATTGIRVVNSSKSFVARNNWLGEKLDGTNGSGSNTGIWLDPESDKAIIGGTAAGQGNVFVNNAAEGLDIEGASETGVMGNYFGVKADGVTKAANGKDIEITDTAAIAATDNEVGDTVSGGAAPCDGPCNVISGATTAGVDLFGNGGNEKPATGPTTIQGNYLGLSAAGTTVVANGEYGVFTGKAGGVTVGGPANGDTNFFAGLGTGIFYSSGEGFKAMGNIFGNGPTGVDLTSPNTAIFVSTLENGLPVMVSGNVMRMEGGVGIEARFGGAEIKNSFIEGAELGIWTKASPGPAGANLIEDNVIGESTANGIRIEDSANLVFGNSVYKSGAAGIRIQNPTGFELVNATKNKIGGNSADRENNINESGGDAIEINNSGGEGASQNEVARNRGAKNAGLFIDLIGATTNGGIEPPTFATSIQSSASGTGAEAGATVRVFRKGVAAAGELESFLAEAVADGSGNWKVSYPLQIPVGTIVAATQTSVAGGTSELVTATSAADPKDDSGKDDKAKQDKDQDKGKGKDDSGVPETTIRKAKIKGATAKFKFSSSEKGAKFECKLDRKKFKPCKSPKTYKGLKPGKHVFKVRAVKGKKVDPTPAKRKFKVVN
ncbi:MAG TPA: NosD domain-containing protein [Solirubrobacterales bacterium]|nr:NosD domain-containing protein [Solirubrobacterales bacterium]